MDGFSTVLLDLRMANSKPAAANSPGDVEVNSDGGVPISLPAGPSLADTLLRFAVVPALGIAPNLKTPDEFEHVRPFWPNR